MANAALKHASVNSEPRKLMYRPHVRWLYKSLMGASILGEALVVFVAIVVATTGNIGSALGLFFAGSLLPLILALEAWFLLRPMAKCFVQVFHDRLILERIGKTIEIPYEEITEVKLSHLPYTGGWCVIRSKGRKDYRFTVVLERSEYILETISAYNPNLFEHKKLENYRRTSIYCDHSWARLYDIPKKWMSLVQKFILLPVGVALLHSMVAHDFSPQMLVPNLFKYTLFNLLLGYVFYLVGEFCIGHHLKKTLAESPAAVVRDTAAENKIQHQINLYFYAVSTTIYLGIIFLRG